MKLVFMLRFMLIVFLSLGINSCCKDPKPGGGTTEPKDPVFKEYWLGEAKDYMYFKKGTWWVYKNMQNGKTDSVYVTLSALDTAIVKGQYDYSKHRTYKIETCRVVTKSQRYNEFYEWYNKGPNPDATDISNPYTSFSRRRTPGGGGKSCFFTPLIEGSFTGGASITWHQKKDTSLVLQGVSYNQVQIYKLIQDFSYPYLLDEEPNNSNFYMFIYYAPGYGIIKYEQPRENKSIELIKSNIIQ